jgi:hypothetical protein
MKLNIKFLDKKEWSYYATLNTLIPLGLLLLFKQKINLEVLTFSAIINFMEGNLLTKILFTGFLNFLVAENKNFKNWVIRSIIFVLSVIIINYIPWENPVHKFAINNKIFEWFLIIAIIIYIIYVFYLIFKLVKKMKR